MKIAAYISGHGFGHLAQMAPVLIHIHNKHPDCQFLIRCSLPKEEIKARLMFDFEIEQSAVDVGVVQKTAIEEDREASIAGLRQWMDGMDDQIIREIALLKIFHVDLVISDISPLAFPAAKALGIAGIGVATLDWYTIYSYWLEATDPPLEQLKQAYSQCDLLLTPPMAMDMQVFSQRKEIPLIAGTPEKMDRPFEKIRPKTALVVFGGSNQPAFDLQALADMDDWQFLIPAVSDAPGNVTSIVFGPNLSALDVMPFVDVVVCKPGYGVLAECWTTGTPMAWVERPDFPEYPMLKGWLMDKFPSCGMHRGDFAAGHWLDALEGAAGHPGSFPPISGDGAEIAAEIIISRLQGK